LIAGIIGLSLSARFPTTAPITPPTTAPTGPPTAPRTAPAAAPAADFEMGGMSMFSLDWDCCAESFDFLAINWILGFFAVEDGGLDPAIQVEIRLSPHVWSPSENAPMRKGSESQSGWLPVGHRTLEAYTAIMHGTNSGTGVELVEVYNLGTATVDLSSEAHLNISTRQDLTHRSFGAKCSRPTEGAPHERAADAAAADQARHGG
jgi:hypothetical protein